MMDSDNNFEEIKTMILRCVAISAEDISILDRSINNLIVVGVRKLKEIAVIGDNAYNWLLSMTDDNDSEYFLELSEHGNIVQLRKDGLEGTLLIDLLSDDVEIISTKEK